MFEHLGLLVYRTVNGKEFDVSKFNLKEKNLLEWMTMEYLTVGSKIEFQINTAYPIIKYAQKEYAYDWPSHPLYQIKLDLAKLIRR